MVGCWKYYKSFLNLTNPREKERRVASLSNKIMHGMMERTKLKEDGLEYIEGNEQLAVDVCIVLNLIKNHLEMNGFKFRFGGLKDQITPACAGEGGDVDELESEDEAETEIVIKEVILTEQIFSNNSVAKKFQFGKN